MPRSGPGRGWLVAACLAAAGAACSESSAVESTAEPAAETTSAPLESATPPVAAEPPERGPWFVADDRDLDHVDISGPTPEQGKDYLLDCIGPGVAVLDVDGDGLLDLYFPQGRRDGLPADASRNVLYANRGERHFERVPDAAGADDDGYGFGALAFDYDADGDVDLLSTNFGPNRLYRNEGGRFQDVSADHPDVVGPADRWTAGAAAADVDLDGDLDLYVANYYEHVPAELDEAGLCRFMGCETPCGPLGMRAHPDVFLRNTGAPSWRFEDRTKEAGFADAKDAYAFQPIFTDVEDDGDLDLYVTNDSMPNTLFLNDGTGVFTEDGLAAGVSLGKQGNREAGMGVAAADVDGDLLPELYVTNFSTQVNALYRNLSADGIVWFQEEAHRSNVGYPTYFRLAWGCSFADFDHDGWLDIFVANGHVYHHVDECPPETVVYRQSNHLFMRVPGEELRFEDREGAAGEPFARPGAWRGSAAVDLDNDGALDLVVAQLDGRPLLAWNDSRGRGHWLQLTMQSRAGDERPWTLAVGARAVVSVGERRWTREVQAGSSFLSTEDPRLHFGLGDAARIDRLSVRWPDGEEAVFDGVDVDRHLVVRRGVDDLLAAEDLAW